MIISKYLFKRLDKKLRLGFVSSAGRNFLGSICVHHRGGGSKKKRYFVDFFRRLNSFGYITKIIKTPFYTSFLGLVAYQNGLCSYIILTDGLAIGSRIFCGTFPNKDKLSELLTIGASVPILYADLFASVSMLNYYLILEDH